MTRTHLPVVASLGIALLLYGASSASAQLPPPPPITTNFNFTVPVALTVSHPCQSGFVLINGILTVALTTIKSSDFKFDLRITGTGSGNDADAAGAVLPNGGPAFAYSSEAAANAQFPDGTPAFFGHQLTLSGEPPAPDRAAISSH